MKIIENLTLDEERALYNIKNTVVRYCTFKGVKDGESALKECSSIEVISCGFYLRYPIWHASTYKVINSTFKETSRAPFWYCSNGEISNTKIYSVKALRECSNTLINGSDIKSEEFGWRCNHIKMNNSSLEGFYAFFALMDSRAARENDDFFLPVILEGAFRLSSGIHCLRLSPWSLARLDSHASHENDVMVRGSDSLIAYQAIHRDFELFAGAELL